MSSIKGRYAKIEIPLDKAETEKELHLSGDYLSIISISGIGTCEIKLDHRHSRTLDLREISEISGFYERIYLTTDGGGGICSLFVGDGMAIHLSPDLDKRSRGSTASTHVTTSTTVVQGLASEPFKLRSVSIFNSNGIYACYVGPYNSDAATFKAHAYVLLPHKHIKFALVDMYALGCIAYDGTNNVIINIIGVYE